MVPIRGNAAEIFHRRKKQVRLLFRPWKCRQKREHYGIAGYAPCELFIKGRTAVRLALRKRQIDGSDSIIRIFNWRRLAHDDWAKALDRLVLRTRITFSKPRSARPGSSL